MNPPFRPGRMNLENVMKEHLLHGFIFRKYSEQSGVLVRGWESEQLDRNSNVFGE